MELQREVINVQVIRSFQGSYTRIFFIWNIQKKVETTSVVEIANKHCNLIFSIRRSKLSILVIHWQKECNRLFISKQIEIT